MTQNGKDPVVLGRISGLFGVKGWFKVHSFTEPREGIFSYTRWLVQDGDDWREVKLAEGKKHGKSLVAHFAEVTDRDAAAELVGLSIAVYRQDMPETADGEYYWHDLEGMQVVDAAGAEIGRVDHLLATGVHDVLVVKGEHEVLVPFVLEEIVRHVDLEQGVISVDWEWE